MSPEQSRRAALAARRRATGVATRPIPPSTYTVPSGTSVTTGAGLATALASSTPATIIVENGSYDNSTYFTVNAAHQVYARNLFGATLIAGIQGHFGGARFQGFLFNATSSAKMLSNYQAHLWGASGWEFYDCKFQGNDSVSAGLAIRSNASLESLKVQRCVASNFHEYGFLIDTNDTTYTPTVPPVISDIYAENCVWQTNPQGSNGVSEAGLWLGCKASVDRCWFHQVPGYATVGARGQLKAWQGLWCGTNVRNCTINDILVTGKIAFGVYSYGPLNSDDVSTVTFNRLETHLPINVGWHAEWNNPSAAHHPNIQNVIVQDSYLESVCVGFHLDQGTVNTTVRRTKFVGQRSAAINNYLQGTPNNLGDTSGNDYSGISGSASSVTTDYAGSYACWNNDTFDP